jgi:predicted  nucleic acid-binding Zn-ribbon protein
MNHVGPLMNKKHTQQDFINRSRERHGDKFDYSRVVYTDRTDKVIIGCPIHGWFTGTAVEHYVSKHGCRDCSIEARALLRTFSQSQVIELFKEVHGDRYDYSLVDYKNMLSPVTIKCNIHGPFPMKPSKHYYHKQQCRDCAYAERIDPRKVSFQEFLSRAKSVHGDKYDYSAVVWDTHINIVRDYITIKCNDCDNVFPQSPQSHMAGRGCGVCTLGRLHPDRRNSMANTHEELSAEFDLQKNHPLTPNDIVAGTNKDLWWNCTTVSRTPCGHSWPAKGSSRSRTGCPKCKKKTQAKVYNLVKELLPQFDDIRFDYKHPKLRFSRTNRKMELDVWIPDLSIGIEYQGEGHYEPQSQWGGEEEFKKGLKRDAQKKEACKKEGITLIEVPYTWEGDIESIKQLLVDNGVNLTE